MKPAAKGWRAKADHRDEGAIAWGKVSNGLQAGLGFRPGDQRSYRTGDSVTLGVHLRNVSDKSVTVSHLETLFDEWLPTVSDQANKKYKVLPGPLNLGSVNLVSRTLDKGEGIRLGTT